MSEQLIPLSAEDRQVLINGRKPFLVLGLGLGIAALLLLSVLILFHSFLWLIMIPGFSFWLATTALVRLFVARLFSKDIRSGQKQIFSGPVEAQNIDVTRTTDDDGVESDASYRFWIQIGGKKLAVTEEQYYQFKKGDLAEAYMAPNSGTVFGVNKEFLKRPFG